MHWQSWGKLCPKVSDEYRGKVSTLEAAGSRPPNKIHSWGGCNVKKCAFTTEHFDRHNFMGGRVCVSLDVTAKDVAGHCDLGCPSYIFNAKNSAEIHLAVVTRNHLVSRQLRMGRH